ncbi:MAG: ATP-binding protein [Bacteroidota bacterium]
MKRQKVLLFLCMYFSSLGIYAQQKKVVSNHLSMQDGLSSNIVSAIAQDSLGFMWFGTSAGLDRFDGRHFDHFRSDQDDPNSIISNVVRDVFVDNEGSLWVAYDNGISKYLFEENRFLNFYTNSENLKIPYAIIRFHQLDSAHLILDQTGKGLFHIFNTQKNRVEISFDAKEYLTSTTSDVYLKLLTIDKRNGIWITLNNKLIRIEYDNNSFIFQDITSLIPPEASTDGSFDISECQDSDKFIISSGNHVGLYDFNNNHKIQLLYAKNYDFNISGVQVFNPKHLWINSENSGLIQLSIDNLEELNRYKHKNIRSQDIQKMERDQDGNIWFIANNELIVLEKKSGSFTHFYGSPFEENALPEFSTGDNEQVFLDNTGTHWLRTTNNGVACFVPKNSYFEVYSKTHNNKGLKNRELWGISTNRDSQLFIGGDQLSLYDYRKGNYLDIDITGIKKSFEGSTTTFTEAKNDLFFIGSNTLNLCKTEGSQLKIIHEFRPDQNKNSIGGWSVITTLLDEDNSLWVGGNFGLSRYIPETEGYREGEFQNKFNFDNTIQPISSQIWFIGEDSKNRLWILTNKGIIRSTPDKKTFSSLKLQNYFRNLKSPVSAKCFLEYPANTYWIATEGAGLLMLSDTLTENIQFSTKSGFPTNHLYSIFNDSLNNLWMSSNRGIIKFNPETRDINIFTESDGLPTRQFNAGSFHKSPYTNKIYFGSNKGCVGFNPNQVEVDHMHGHLTISKLFINNQPIGVGDTVNGQQVLKKAITHLDEVTLSHENREISFQLSHFNFVNPNQVRYSYKIVNYHNSWQVLPIGQDRISLMGLPQGEFVLKVKSYNHSEKETVKETELRITILPPWWKSLWAYLAYAVVLICLFLIIRRIMYAHAELKHKVKIEQLNSEKAALSLKTNKLELEKQKEVEEMKTRFFMNVSHEFRTPLTLILAPLEALIKRTKEAEAKSQLTIVKRNANRLLKLVNQLLDMRKLETGNMKLSVSCGNVEEFMNDIFNTFKPLAESYGIDYQLNIECEESLHRKPWTGYFDPDILEKILFNLLSNAFKFTPQGGAVWLNVRFDEYYIQIEVTDTGTGIPENDLPHIFDRFFCNTHNKTGTGIGLAFTKEITHLHKGTLRVKSNTGEHNHGTTFTLEIPISAEKFNDFEISEKSHDLKIDPMTCPDIVPVNQGNNSSNTLSYKTKSLSVLIVDDNKDMLSLLEEHLKDEYHILTANNGLEAYNASVRHLPDLIISDVMMPEIDGIELSKKLKTDVKTSHIPIILLTAKATEKEQLEGLQTGVDDYISKPFNLDILKQKINNIFKNRKQLIKKYQENNFKNPISTGLNTVDQEFIKKLIDVIHEDIENPDLNVDYLAKKMFVSRAQLYRKMKALTGQSVNEFIRSVILHKSKEYLTEPGIRIIEVAEKCGYTSTNNFSTHFKNQFGCTPKAYIKSLA